VYNIDFSWIVTSAKTRLVNNNGNFVPPANALNITTEHNDNGPYYYIVANPTWGLIPGKANTHSSWYPYGCKEHNADDSKWIVLE
jgi:hypothetical protein